MTDATIAPLPRVRRLDVNSDAMRKRVAGRYRSERRFRALGIGALAITAIFLVALIFNIVSNAIPAFTQHSALIDVPLPADAFPPQDKRDAAGIRGADYNAITRNALSAIFPGVEGRVARRQLTGILSSGAADDLRSEVVSDPSIIGTTRPARLLLSDDADLYLKDPSGASISSEPGGATATPSGLNGDVTITTSSNGLAPLFKRVKQELLDRSAALNAEATRLERIGSPELTARVTDLRAQSKTMKDEANGADATLNLDSKMPSALIELNGGVVKLVSLGTASATGTTLLSLKSIDTAQPGKWKLVTFEVPESERRLGDPSVVYLEKLKEQGKIERHFNTLLFTAGDSREPELAGIRGALVGSALTLLVTLVLCLPIGVLAAIYLEEFAPKNRLTDVIEVNINNLAAVPSIVFGLLGLAVFLNFFNLPRSAPLVGGLVLALLVLPTIIIASRAAIRAVPPSIREAALGVGASHQQAVFHHVLPLAMPGIMTGTIIGMAHALGETAPLLMIGMVAFIVDVPSGVTSAATVLPVQIYLWSDLPEPAFQQKTAAAILVLLGFLFAMNGAAIWLRSKFERRW